jgi:hypothetical protein
MTPAAEKTRDSYRKNVAEFEQAHNTEVPEAMRALAEKNITQTREVYKRSKDALETCPRVLGESLGRGRSGRCGAKP